MYVHICTYVCIFEGMYCMYIVLYVRHTYTVCTYVDEYSVCVLYEC